MASAIPQGNSFLSEAWKKIKSEKVLREDEVIAERVTAEGNIRVKQMYKMFIKCI